MSRRRRGNDQVVWAPFFILLILVVVIMTSVQISKKSLEEVYWAIGEMELMRGGYFKRIHRQPLGWIMGIDEYTKLKKAIASQLGEEQRKELGELSNFQGLPIIIKSTKGIELSIDIAAAEFYEKNKEKIRKEQEDLLG